MMRTEFVRTRSPWRSRAILASLALAIAAFSAPVELYGQPGRGPAPVEARPVERAVVSEEILLSGSVVPRRASLLASEVSGRVAEVFVDEGDYVTEGQELLRLRLVPTELRLRQLEAEVAIEQAVLDELLAGTRDEDIAVQRAEEKEAEAALELAKSEERRLRELRETEAVSASEYDRIRTQMLRAEAVVARESAETERAVSGPRTEEIERQRGEVAARQAEVQQISDELERHIIRAPFDGIIGEKLTEVGQWITPGQAAFAMAELDILRVEVRVPERHFPDITPGTRARVAFDSLPDLMIEDEVDRRVPLAGEASRTFPVMVEFENEGYRVAPGMLARVTFEVAEEGAAESLLVPRDAVVMTPDRTRQVWVVREGEEGPAAFPQDVETGRVYRDMVEVTNEGLQTGDLVIVRGNERLYPSQPVAVKEGS